MSDLLNQNEQFIKSICDIYPEYNYIDPKNYENHNVKRGLRNSDNTGVLAGISRVGAAYGAYIQDGERIAMDGKLIYRGRDIRDLVAGSFNEDRFGFEEVVYLLLFGHLPNPTRLTEFEDVMKDMRKLPVGFIEDMIIKAPSMDIMNKLGRCVLALYSYDENPDDCSLPNLLRQSIELVSRAPIIVAHAFAVKRHYFDKESLILHHTQDNLTLAENFLFALRPDNKYTKEEARLLDMCIVLHAEHGGGNNSTFAARVLSSSGTDTYSAISAAIGSLKGPKHGGANIKVMQMFNCIKENVSNWENDDEVSSFLEKLIRKEEGDKSGLIYGMGHAVYTLSDPRAILLKKHAKELAAKHSPEMFCEFKLLESVERLTPVVFSNIKGDKKTISANVDMYSGLVYKMLNIPPELYTPLFAVARIAGWCAHRVEEVLYNGRIVRPAYKFIADDTSYIPLDER